MKLTLTSFLCFEFSLNKDISYSDMIYFFLGYSKFLNVFLGETEEEFSTRLANNLENLILKEGPETV